MNESVEYPCYYAVLEANVRYDKRLTPSEKLLYAEISALTNASGKCTAKNKYFAELYQQGESTIRRWISNLVKYGYIKVDGEGKSRVITLFENASTRSKMSNEPAQNRANPIKYNLNNKYYSFNITRENNSACAREGDTRVSQNRRNRIGNYSQYTPEQIKFQKAFPKRIANDIRQIPDKVDVDLLIESIKKCPWLMKRNNMSFKACVEKYDLIISGEYAPDGQEWQFKNNSQKPTASEKDFGGDR